VKKHTFPIRIFYLFPGLIILLFYVWQQIQVVLWGYKIESVQKEINYYDDQNRELRLKIGHLTSLDHVEKIAKEKLHMEPAKDNVIIILPSR